MTFSVSPDLMVSFINNCGKAWVPPSELGFLPPPLGAGRCNCWSNEEGLSCWAP